MIIRYISIILFSLTLSLPLYAASASKIGGVIEKGDELYDQGRYEKAVSIYQDALELIDPTCDSLVAKVHYGLINAYVALNNYDMAEKHCKELLGIEGYYRQYVVKMGEICNAEGMFDKAIMLYETGLVEYPNDYKLLCNLGKSLLNAGRFKEAEHVMIRALNVEYMDAQGHQLLAKAMIGQNQRVQAILSLYSSLALSPYTENSVALYDILFNDLKKIELPYENIGLDQFCDVSVSMLEFAKEYTYKHSGKNITEQFMELTRHFFTQFSKYREVVELDSFWAGYSDIYAKIVDKGYTEALCYYISLCTHSKYAFRWLESNRSSLDGLFSFFRDNNFNPTLTNKNHESQQ